MKRHATTLLLTFFVMYGMAQGDVEYRAEIGGGIGLVNYKGDYNSKLLNSPQPMASVVFRRTFNPYTGLKFNIGAGKLKGSSKDEKTYYPGSAAEPYEFSHTLVDGGATFEYNLWPYGTGREYRGAQRLTPFIFIGLGLTYVKTDEDNIFTGNLPVGLGLKYKMADRLNLGIEWGIHFSLSDELDGSRDPYLIKSTGIFKNTDCYSALQVTLTYSFMAKCRTCHNADE